MNDCLSVCDLLKAAAACSERRLNESLSDVGVSHCQATILLRISEGPASMSSLSKAMCCHKSNITQVVAGLSKKKMIERVTSTEDKRVTHLKLTPVGKQAAQKLKGVLCDCASDCMDIFTASEKKTLASLLQKYIDRHRDA